MGGQGLGADEMQMKVFIITRHCLITGSISLIKGARLTDFVVASKPFIAVTDAEVTDHEGRALFTSTFVNVHRDHIEVIAPMENVAAE